eukprot:CAMPEP_0184343618 /NCGR_PEP_ID=MMETSP1089-20130417/12123_1 /TAXON_ID=38269 ORGANISM="Gloeochaete wittrockiana, Strain SAG46.84" /NCGR_SAMPLE_ID=MMETSP1089 /ASSEMBLY_ACC=CAM_ASM_000445 /LENGTH=407 /DNA_ID=CAMNT_0026672999 /DNA_START=55 /DNA_END=1278 /DNA_ORIENTATION=-
MALGSAFILSSAPLTFRPQQGVNSLNVRKLNGRSIFVNVRRGPVRTLSVAHFRRSGGEGVVFCSARGVGVPRGDHTIAVIGDIHNQWDVQDHACLRKLSADIALFVGDFAMEEVEIVKTVSALQMDKAVILGNHDASRTALSCGLESAYPYHYDTFKEILDSLGDTHVGFGYKDYHSMGLSVVGGRPCSFGSKTWANAEFYHKYFGVRSCEDSVKRMVTSVVRSSHRDLILLAHNGPYGLGAQPNDPCGRDWIKGRGGDFGDWDLREAIKQTQERETGKRIRLVAFGHMHRDLQNGLGKRRMVHRDRAGTVYLNAAVCPRVVPYAKFNLRNFCLVTMSASGPVKSIRNVWVDDKEFKIRKDELWYEESQADENVTQTPSHVGIGEYGRVLMENKEKVLANMSGPLQR